MSLPVCRSLFEKDKLLFAFGVAAGLQVDSGKMDSADLRFLLTGGVAVGDLPAPNPCPGWLSDKSWGEVCRASKLPDPIWQVSKHLSCTYYFPVHRFSSVYSHMALMHAGTVLWVLSTALIGLHSKAYSVGRQGKLQYGVCLLVPG